MKKIISLLGIIFLLGVGVSLFYTFDNKFQDIHTDQGLKKHFRNTRKFTSWYKTLSQDDKNQVLAGTVALCRPDLMSIAIQNGGDTGTHVMTEYVSFGHDGPQITFIYSSSVHNAEEEENLHTQINKRISENMKEDDCDHSFALTGFPIFGSLAVIAVDSCNFPTTEEILKLLKRSQVDISQAEQELLNKASNKNDLNTIKHLLEKGVQINSFEEFRSLHHAEKQTLDLIFSHIGINYQDKNGETALFSAVQKRRGTTLDEQINLVKYLLEKGIDVNILNNKGENAFDNCAYPLCRLHPEGLKRFTIDHPKVEKALYYAQKKKDSEQEPSTNKTKEKRVEKKIYIPKPLPPLRTHTGDSLF